MKKLLLLICILSFACTSQKSEELTIPVVYNDPNLQDFENSDYQFDFEIIPLRADTSNRDSYAATANSIVLHKDFIYIISWSSPLKIYDTKGNFIKSLALGKGPGELPNMGMIFNTYIDKDEDCIRINCYKKNLKYNLKGEFIGTFDIEEEARFLTGSECLAAGNYSLSYNEQDDSSIVKIFNIRTRSLTDKVVDFPNNKKWAYLPMNTFVLSGEDVYFNVPIDNVIYKLNKGDSVSQKFAKIESLFSVMPYPDHTEMQQIYNQAKNDNCYLLLRELSVNTSGNFLSFNLLSGSKEVRNVRVFYDKIKNQIYKYPIQSFDLLYSDGEYDYFFIYPDIYELRQEKFTPGEMLLAEKYNELISKNGIDINPCLLKIKIVKK